MAAQLFHTRILRLVQLPGVRFSGRAWTSSTNFSELRACELRRITLPRTPVNKAASLWVGMYIALPTYSDVRRLHG